jgi:hypothetical protein
VCTAIAGLNVYLLYQALGAAGVSFLAALAAAFALWVRFFYRGE